MLETRASRALRVSAALLVAISGWAAATTASAAAIPISCGQTVSGAIPAGQTVTYSFNATMGDVVVIHITGSMSGVPTLFPPGGGSGEWITGASPLPITETGTQSIVLGDTYGGSGTYAMNLQFTKGGTAQCSPTAISCGVTATGAVSGNADTKAYTFTAGIGDTVLVRTLKTSGSLYPEAVLYGPLGGSVGSVYYGDPIPLTEAGKYTIIVHDSSLTSSGNFSLDLQFTTGNCAKAALSCGTTQNSSLQAFGWDAFTFNASANDAIVLSVHAAGASSLLEAGAVLYGPDGSHLMDVPSYSPNNAGAPHIATATGKYTVLVADGSSSKLNTGAYNLQLQFTNGICGTAIGCGQTTDGSVGVIGQFGAYRYVGEASSILMLAAKALSGGINARVRVYGPSGANLSSSGSTSQTLELAGSGTYTVLVGDEDYAPSTGTYQLATSCASAPTDFFGVAPCRAIDTRDAALGGPMPVAAGADKAFTIGGRCGIPATAKAVSMNVTVTQPSGPGDLRFYPAGATLPLVSLINYGLGQTRANNGLVPLGAGGQVVVHCDQAAGNVHVIMDVNGYFP